MRRLFTALAATGILTASAMPSFAQDRLLTGDDLFPWKGWYASVFGGIHFKGNENGTTSVTGLGSIGSRHRFDTGFQAGVALGYSWQFTGTPWALRLEGEYAFSHNGADTLSLGGVTGSVNGSLRNHSIVGNLYVDYHWGKWVPYLGAGVGVAITHLNSGVPGAPLQIDGTDTNFAVQAMAGIDYKILPRWKLGVGYKYQAVFSNSYDVVVTGSNTSVGKANLGTIDSHTVLLKLGYLF
jgi:opacity protein-like surface antigen